MPGYDLHVLSPGPDHIACAQNGSLLLKLPLPLGTLPTRWNDDADVQSLIEESQIAAVRDWLEGFG
jgi:hypothetical protein